MEVGDLVWLIAFVAWLLSGVLGRAARKRMTQAPPPPSDPRMAAGAPGAQRRVHEEHAEHDEIEPWGDEDEDERWEPAPGWLAPPPSEAPAQKERTPRDAWAAPPPPAPPALPSRAWAAPALPRQPPRGWAPTPRKPTTSKPTGIPTARRHTARRATRFDKLELARAVVLADLLDRPVALRTTPPDR